MYLLFVVFYQPIFFFSLAIVETTLIRIRLPPFAYEAIAMCSLKIARPAKVAMTAKVAKTTMTTKASIVAKKCPNQGRGDGFWVHL